MARALEQDYDVIMPDARATGCRTRGATADTPRSRSWLPGVPCLPLWEADRGTCQCALMTQVAADALGMPPERLAFELSDTKLPYSLVAGAWSGVCSVGPADRMASEAARAKVLELAMSDADPPLAGYGPEAIGA